MTDFDRIEKLGASVIQHGPYNNRIYLMKLDSRDIPEIFSRLDALARDAGYTKIFAKVPGSYASVFSAEEFIEEARVPGFFNRREDGIFTSKFLDPRRRHEHSAPEVAKNIALAEAKRNDAPSRSGGPQVIRLTPQHVDEMATIYRTVFASYPFPIHDPDYLLQTMQTHVKYFGIAEEGRLVAVASSELTREAENVEMTDFATLPDHLGRGYAVHLLQHMEGTMQKEGMKTAFTLARSLSPGMNITFAKLGYTFAGTLTNNTNISGAIESMNAWYKALTHD